MQLTLNLLAYAILPLLGRYFFTLASPMIKPSLEIRENSARTTNTCADPSLSQVYYQGFEAGATVHLLDTWIDIANFNTFTATPAIINMRPAFHAWQDQQPFTVPLFRVVNGGATEYLFLIGADAQSPPNVSGFSDAGLIAWVYDSPVCGSVPLLSAVNAAATDHFYTTIADEHTRLVAISGWADTGIVAYVLPVTTP